MSKILQTPSINSIVPFDPLYDYTVNFTYSDNQSLKNRAVITDNSTNEVVYDKTQTTMRLQHTIPANTLTAGKQYLIQIQVFDADGNSSNLSSPVLFYCFSTPIFSFDISDDETIKNASITLNLNYVQSEDEPIKSFQFFQYSYDKFLLNSSPVFYSNSDMSYSFYGLGNNLSYYFRAIGETNHGITLDTGYIKVNVLFNTVKANILLDAENHYRDGYISLRLNIKDIGYKLDNDNYELKDGLLILKNNSLTYNEGFTVPDDFSLFVEAKELPVRTFLTTNDNMFSLSIVDVCGTYYCKLEVKNSSFVQYESLPKAKLVDENGRYLVTDNNQMIEIVDSTYGDDVLVVFEVKRINGYYGLKVYYKSEQLN